MDIAFHVDSVIGIHRVSWKDIIKPGATVSSPEDGISTGIIKYNEKDDSYTIIDCPNYICLNHTSFATMIDSDIKKYTYVTVPASGLYLEDVKRALDKYALVSETLGDDYRLSIFRGFIEHSSNCSSWNWRGRRPFGREDAYLIWNSF